MNCTLTMQASHVQQCMADPRNRCGGCHVKIGLGKPLSLPKIGPTPGTGVIADFVSPQIVSPRTESASRFYSVPPELTMKADLRILLVFSSTYDSGLSYLSVLMKYSARHQKKFVP